MIIGALGDIHGAFDAARAAIARHPEASFWLCVGDVADDNGTYASLGAPVYWIHGNNDDFDAIAAGDLPPDLHHLANGTATRIGAITVAGLGGTFAPTWYDKAAADLPHGRSRAAADPDAASSGRPRLKALDDKRRHFVRAEVEAASRLRGVDVLLTHEAAKPFRPFPGGRGPDAGKAQINEVLRAMQPRVHLFGHHHRVSEQLVEGVRSYGLDLVTRSYALLHLPGLEVELRPSGPR